MSRVFTQVVGPGAMGCGCRIAATELTAREAVLVVRPGDVWSRARTIRRALFMHARTRAVNARSARPDHRVGGDYPALFDN